MRNDRILFLKETLDALNLDKYSLEGNRLKVTNMSKLAQWEKQGYTKYMWVAMNDKSTRPSHSMLNRKVFKIKDGLEGKTPIPGNIRINGKIAPREIFNCRCKVIPIK